MGFGSVTRRCLAAATGFGALWAAAAGSAVHGGQQAASKQTAHVAADGPAAGAEQSRLIEQRIADVMHLDRFDVQSLDVPETAVRAPLTIEVELAGRTTALALSPNSARSAGFGVWTQNGDGRLVKQAAAQPSTYRGHVVDDPDAPVAATVRHGQLRAYILEGGQSWIIEPVAAGVGLADRSAHVVYRKADVRPGDWTCGAVADPIGPPAQGGAFRGGSGSCASVCEIAIDADVDYYELNNSSIDDTTADIEMVINAMNLIYGVELGITHEITDLIIHTDQPSDPFDTTSPGGILDALAMYRTNNPYPGVMPDVSHLFTGKDIDGGVIGIAYLAAICDTSRGFGVSQSQFSDNFALRVQVTTHELGHNWDARHCDGDPDCAIMCSHVGGCSGVSDSFGSRSRVDITDFRNSSACLSEGSGIFPGTGQLIQNDLDEGDNFGIAVDVAEQTAIVGAFADDEAGNNAGAAYIFDFTGTQWVQNAKLVPMDLEAEDRMGNAVAIDARDNVERAVIGAYLDTGVANVSGSAYIYESNGGPWALFQKIVADPKGAGDLFGSAVAINGDFIIIGAPRANPKGSDSGAAYVFEFNGVEWVQQAQLTAGPDFGDPNDQFGTKVAISSTMEHGTVAAVSAWLDDESASNAGAVYLYRYDEAMDEWNFEAKLCPALQNDQFGISVDIDGDRLAVGAWNDDDASSNGGAVYVFDYDGSAWQQTYKITAATSVDERLGGSVALTGSTIVAGAYFNDFQAMDSGAVYVFRYNGADWVQGQVWHVIDGSGDQFGVSVGVSPNVGIGGAWRHDQSGVNDSGAAFAFSIGGEPEDCNGNGVPDICDLVTGVVDDCNNNGIPDTCDIAEGISPDKDGNGIPDACDSDCNDNGITDSTEIADGSVPDCNDNGFPDSCDVDPTDPDGDGMVSSDVDGDGVPDECAPDCNENGVPDPIDIADGTEDDCNVNGVPDSCELADYTAMSGPLSPVDGDVNQSLVLNGGNNPPPFAQSDVTITIAANGDLGQVNEYAALYVDGEDVATLFLSGAEDCPGAMGLLPDIETRVIPAADWNAKSRPDGAVNLTVDFRNTVESDQCMDDFVSIAVQYTGGDCNNNGLLDICEISDETVVDCNENNIPDVCEIGTGDCNENGIPDECDVADGFSMDDNMNGIPDECECSGDLNGDDVVDVFDLFDLLTAWGSCANCPADLDNNGVIDVFDLFLLLGNWGGCA